MPILAPPHNSGPLVLGQVFVPPPIPATVPRAALPSAAFLGFLTPFQCYNSSDSPLYALGHPPNLIISLRNFNPWSPTLKWPLVFAGLATVGPSTQDGSPVCPHPFPDMACPSLGRGTRRRSFPYLPCNLQTHLYSPPASLLPPSFHPKCTLSACTLPPTHSEASLRGYTPLPHSHLLCLAFHSSQPLQSLLTVTPLTSF